MLILIIDNNKQIFFKYFVKLNKTIVIKILKKNITDHGGKNSFLLAIYNESSIFLL